MQGRQTKVINLSDKWIDYLVNQPETGIGYQIVDITMIDGRVFGALVVVGGCYLYFPDDFDIEEKDIGLIRVQIRH